MIIALLLPIREAIDFCIFTFFTALLLPTTPVYIIVLVLFTAGLFRSLQFSSLTTLAFTDTPAAQTTAANTLYSTVQQMSTGMGIAKEDCERIFKEFTRLPGAQGAEGFGLGLSITKKLVLLLGGKISVDSVPGQGTCFTVIMPFEKTDRTIPEEIHEESFSIDEEKSVHCLLVDDDRLQLELTASLMKRYKFSCVCCEHPKEVVDLLSEQKFDFVF